MTCDVLLNCLPPFRVKTPSAALSILKKFLSVNDVDVQIKYWNIEFESILNKHINYKNIYDELVLSVFIAAGIVNKEEDKLKCKTLLYAYKKDTSLSFSDFDIILNKLTVQIKNYIEKELQNEIYETLKIFGISLKYHQWIPGLIIAKELKLKYPNIKIVIGGIDNKETAITMLDAWDCLDFAIWGEGEYPLLNLYKSVKKNNSNYSEIQNLVYRENGKTISSKSKSKSLLDFDNYLYPDYDDYLEQLNKHIPNSSAIQLPINAIRGCNWNKCKFCVSKIGYTYRERSPECVTKEICQLINKYNIYDFEFVDNCSYRNNNELTRLAELLIKHINSSGKYIRAEMTINHTGISHDLINNLFIAGIRRIQIGFESFSENLLKLMDKQNSLSDNILFVKNALKYNILLPLILITDIPKESINEITESIDNLHYFRFYLNNKNFNLPFSTLLIQYKSRYYNQLKASEREQYNSNKIVNILPNEFRIIDLNKHIFQYEKEVKQNLKEWLNFEKVLREYQKNIYSYRLIKKNNIFFYFEYCNEKEIKSIEFDDPLYFEVLNLTNSKICSFNLLYNLLLKNNEELKKDSLNEIIYNLKSKYLLYANNDLTEIVSTILLNDV